MNTTTARKAVSDNTAIWVGSEGVYGSSSNTVVRKWENVNPKDVKDAEEYLRQYTSEKNGGVKRLYVTGLKIHKVDLEGKWRGGKVSSKKEEEGNYSIFQELHEGFVTTTLKNGSVVFTEWVTEDGNLYRSGSGNTVLKLPNVDPANVEDIRQELQANETYTNLKCKYETIGGTNHYIDSIPVRERDGGFSIILFLSKHYNADYRFVYNVSPNETHVHFFKRDMSNTPSNIQAFHDDYYFDPLGDFYVSSDDINYSAKNGETASGVLSVDAPDAKRLTTDVVGRSVPSYSPAPDRERGEVNLHVRIIYRTGYQEEYDIGTRRHYVGWHVELPPSTAGNALETIYTKLNISGVVESDQVTDNEDDGTWSWHIVSSPSRTDDGGTDPSTISGCTPMLITGEPLEQERFVKHVVGADLPSTHDLVGRYEDVRLNGDEVESATIPDVLRITSPDTDIGADWLLYDFRDANNNFIWWRGATPPYSFDTHRIFRDAARGNKWTLLADDAEWHNNTTSTGTTPPSNGWWPADSGYDAPGDITISGTGTAADAAWGFADFDSNGFAQWSLGADSSKMLFRDPDRDNKWTLKWGIVKWYNDADNLDFYPPSGGWNTYAGTGIGDIKVFGTGTSADFDSDAETIFKFVGTNGEYGSGQWEASNSIIDGYPSDLWWLRVGESSDVWQLAYQYYSPQIDVDWFHSGGSKTSIYPPDTGWSALPNYPYYSAPRFEHDEYHPAYPAPTLSNTGAYTPSVEVAPVVEGVLINTLSGRRLVVTRARNAQVRDGKLHYDLYETVFTSPINIDDDWYLMGVEDSTEFDERWLKSHITFNQNPVTNYDDYVARTFVACRMRPITTIRRRKFFIRKPTAANLESAGIDLTLRADRDPTEYNSGVDVRYISGRSSVHLYFYDEIITTRGAWVGNTVSPFDIGDTNINMTAVDENGADV